MSSRRWLLTWALYKCPMWSKPLVQWAYQLRCVGRLSGTILERGNCMDKS